MKTLNIRFLKKYINAKRPKSKYVNIKLYIHDVQKIDKFGHWAENWTNAFQKAIDENECIYIPKGKYYINNSIVIPSNRKILASKNAEICLIYGTKVLMMRNQNVINGQNRKILDNEPINENISICGGLWSEESTCRLGQGKSGRYDDEDSFHGVGALLFFSGVNNLSLKNMKFKNVSSFCVQIGRCNNVVVKNLQFINCFSDGVHFNGDVKNAYVKNIKGETGDDLVALNAYDFNNATINNGSIQNLVIEDIHPDKKRGLKSVRLLAGVKKGGEEDIDCFIQNVYLSNMTGLCVAKMYLQTAPYIGKPEPAGVGWMKNIHFNNIKIRQLLPTDSMPNFRNKDLETGNFGVFEIGTNIQDLYLTNIKAEMNKKDYPLTSHFITVGPRTGYIEQKKLEIFDPYIECAVKNIYYKNIRINGKNIRDLTPEIREVKFDKLYESEMPFGYGKVENIKEIKLKNEF